MNEPSVFDQSELTLPKVSKFIYNGITYETRDSHNIYGYLMHKTSYEAMRKKYNKRPFLLTRSFYIGSHRYGATWTGDTRSSFHDLKLSISMILNNSISGYSFVGADVGGFAGEGQHYLYYRWYQLGVFNPFFRAHSQNETWRREPWLYDSETLKYIKNAVTLRYKLLPYIYTMFYKSHNTGYPILRPLWIAYEDKSIDEFSNVEFMFGDSILVRPIVDESEHFSNDIRVLLPEVDRWYDFFNHTEIMTKGDIMYPTTNDNIPVFIRGGSVIPMKLRVRRSTKILKHDPLTLIIALDNDGKASGLLYLDDEVTYSHEEKEEYIFSKITVDNEGVRFTNLKNNFTTKSYIERVIILGYGDKIAGVTSQNGSLNYTHEKDKLTIHKANLSLSEDWIIQLQINNKTEL
jgi:alpha 1,3-glucosidase